MKNCVFLLVALLVLSACEPVVNYRGSVDVSEEFGNFVVGKTTMGDVIKKCGTPSLHKDNYTWIYIGYKSEERAFKSVEVTSKFVVRLRFDRSKILKSVEVVTPKDDIQVFMDEDIPI